ncbi:NAD-dependent dehydratase [Niastella koreensis]|uniref:NmrA family protein n=2 Tax=Niastella koreensis TaxID=354356 RepID=G8T7V9_NIAKG|nr:NAD(P)H-binding protein [Niastella koreensis]AEV96897.1 NmrA family protein [Niastella koreensis GR20-10]OQP49243.1 NAD-dependent dehydratase [Niastella koreensis]
MKIVVTGSLGNISRPLTELLVSQGHEVTVISSDPKKQAGIAQMGATAAIGSITDPSFLTETFSGADAVYAMIPLSFTEPDLGAYMHRAAKSYVQALNETQVKRVIVLSGWAADLVKAENVEYLFDGLNTSLTIMRPASFYTNFYQSIDLIKGKGVIGKYLTLRYNGLRAFLTGKTGLLMGNYGGDDRIVFVSPKDIADAVAEELQLLPEKKTIRYVGSEEMTCNEAARIIGTAIGKPWLRWVLLTDKEMLQGLKMAKVPEKLAQTLVEMQAVTHSGKTLENFHRANPKMGKVKLREFAQEFAIVYHQK